MREIATIDLYTIMVFCLPLTGVAIMADVK